MRSTFFEAGLSSHVGWRPTGSGSSSVPLNDGDGNGLTRRDAFPLSGNLHSDFDLAIDGLLLGWLFIIVLGEEIPSGTEIRGTRILGGNL